MCEKPQKRKQRKNRQSDQSVVGTTSSVADENRCLSEQDFEDIPSKVENRVSK